MTAPQALSDFLGTWDIERRIDSDRPGQGGRFRGTATISARESGALYHEKGRLMLPDGTGFLAERRYHWSADGTGGIAVRFDDGRPFHRIGLGAPGARDDHLCAADMYRVAYGFSRWPLWQSRWQVTGPAKDYLMVSDYRRSAASDLS
ncbi:DUF6314 family protein [Oceanomicrobium pacificus]|uniref:DUF6314 domain-containing protein n=1 Tax=Oceanomicrobium pacificus TaxID=2692916 RepID=A0A6B0TWU9_9RHOB|nr:DUF6314 family protein [Oceanomicrobium pacificus]MXU65752.1 hypothetical protein [Oceanomicrobium pacificus]